MGESLSTYAKPPYLNTIHPFVADGNASLLGPRRLAFRNIRSVCSLAQGTAVSVDAFC